MISDLLAKYNDELASDLVIDELNLKEVQLTLPGKKHLWIGRLIRHKTTLNELKNSKKEKISELINKLKSTSEVKLTTPVAEKYANNVPIIADLNKQINDTELIIEYLEKVEKILTSMSFDIKNIIEIQKLETL